MTDASNCSMPARRLSIRGAVWGGESKGNTVQTKEGISLLAHCAVDGGDGGRTQFTPTGCGMRMDDENAGKQASALRNWRTRKTTGRSLPYGK